VEILGFPSGPVPSLKTTTIRSQHQDAEEDARKSAAATSWVLVYPFSSGNNWSAHMKNMAPAENARPDETRTGADAWSA